MYSLNVPIPRSASALAWELARELPEARARDRDEQTLVVKRFGTDDRAVYQRRAARVREVLRGMAAFEARIDEVDYFADPPAGPAPVIYLAVESPGLEHLHARLTDEFGAADGLEGDAYVPHVTVARGGDEAAAQELAERSIDPIEWSVTEVTFWDATRGEPTGSISLPA